MGGGGQRLATTFFLYIYNIPLKKIQHSIGIELDFCPLSAHKETMTELNNPYSPYIYYIISL